MSLRIKGWEQFQHFKDRRPPWIKLYRDILDDPDWHELSDKASKYLVMFWLIASENEGYLPELKKLAFRLRTTEKALNQVVSELSHWLDNTISTRYHDDAPEGETEGETEEEKRERQRKEAEGSAVSLGDTTPASIVLSIPLNDRSEFTIDQPMVDEWMVSYPAVDVVQQLREMRSWCLANPANRKTPRGVTAFIVRWLGKEQDKGSRNSGETAYQRSMRERVAEFSPGLAKQSPDFSKTFVQEVSDVIAIAGR